MKGTIEIQPEAFGKLIRTKTELKEFYKDLAESIEYKKAEKYLDEGNIIIYCNIDYDGIDAITDILKKAKLKYMECEQ